MNQQNFNRYFDTRFLTNIAAQFAGLFNTNMTADTTRVKRAGDTVTGGLTSTVGAAAAAAALRFGKTATEGYELKVIDQQLDLAAAAASFDLTEDIPAGAVILSAQANLETLIGATTAVKVGLGIAADPDKYGKTSALTKNLKIDTIPAYAVLAGAEDIKVFAVDAAGAAAGTIGGTAGNKVRVRIVYAACKSLDNAA
jgi:hypothetical protein